MNTTNGTLWPDWCGASHPDWGPLDDADAYSLTPCFQDTVLWGPLYLIVTVWFVSKLVKFPEATPEGRVRSDTHDKPLSTTAGAPGVGSQEYLLLDDDDGYDLAELCAKRTPEAYEILCDLASRDLVKEATNN